MQSIKVCHEASGRATRRRQFMNVLAGAGLIVSIGFASNPARADGTDPKPIGGGIQLTANGPLIHYNQLLPVRQGVEFSSVTDFDGILGAAHVENMGTLTDKITGKTYRYPFKTDIRFMQGNYVGEDGTTYAGTFAMIILRIQETNGGPDIKCVCAGVAPSGLVSTKSIDPTGLAINYNGGNVDLRVRNHYLYDFGTLNAALSNGPSKQSVALRVLNAHWKAPRNTYDFTDNQYFFRGNYTETKAIAEFTIESATFKFVTDVDSTSHEDFAVVAKERNGLWF